MSYVPLREQLYRARARDGCTTTLMTFQDSPKIMLFVFNAKYPSVVDAGVVKSLSVVKTLY